MASEKNLSAVRARDAGEEACKMFKLSESEDAGQFPPRSGPITGVLFGCQLSKLIVAADTLKVNNRKCFFVENEFLKCPPALSREIDSSQPRSQQTPALGS